MSRQFIVATALPYTNSAKHVFLAGEGEGWVGLLLSGYIRVEGLRLKA